MGLLPGGDIPDGASGVSSWNDGQTEPAGSFDKELIERIVFGRWWIPATYHFTIWAVVLVFVVRYWAPRLRVGTASGHTEKQTVWRPDSTQSERAPLLESLEPKSFPRGYGWWRRLPLKLRAVLTYQPPPIPIANKILPSNGNTLIILLFLAINLVYLNYNTGSTFPSWITCIMDRAGLLFVGNLPWLYILAAKNQPLRLLTGDSYESLNILHRRLGEWMCFLAVWHVVGFFAFWWYYASPYVEDPLATLLTWLMRDYIYVGIGAFFCYEVLWATSLSSFRQWWYECFLASHVVLQAAGLLLIFFHHHATKMNALAALAIFVIDRVLYRAILKSRTMKANLEILEDGETLLLSADWSIPPQEPRLRKVFGRDIQLGWKPLEHVFITVPALGRGHALQAHPFTIASAAPEGSEHAWLSLIMRARVGFTKRLLQHARSHFVIDVRFDGPYGSQHAVEMLRQSDTAVLVAGGSGIAVAYPVIWSLLHNVKAGSDRVRCKRVSLIWIIREASHISWIGIERLDELRELGLHLVLPEPTTKAGRPAVRRLLVECIEDVMSSRDGEKIGVVVSAPDAMNREVNNACARLAWEGRNVNVAVEKFGW